MKERLIVVSGNFKKYVEESGIDARFFEFEKHTMTADAAARRLGKKPENIIKSIIFIDDEGLPVLAIVTGDKRIDENKLAIACDAKKLRKATPSEVKEISGYEVGAVPPLGHMIRIRTFIDEKVMTLSKVIGGGGATNILVEMNPEQIAKIARAKVQAISR